MVNFHFILFIRTRRDAIAVRLRQCRQQDISDRFRSDRGPRSSARALGRKGTVSLTNFCKECRPLRFDSWLKFSCARFINGRKVIRFRRLTAILAALFVTPVADAASPPYVGSGSFNSTAGTWASVSTSMSLPGNQSVYFPVVSDRDGRRKPIEFTIVFSVSGEWDLRNDYQVSQ